MGGEGGGIHLYESEVKRGYNGGTTEVKRGVKRGSRQVSYLDDVVPRHEAIVALQVAVYDWYCVGMEVAHAAADVREHGQKRVLPRKTNGLVLEDITERSEFHEFLQYAQTPEGMWTWYVDMEMERRETKKRRRRGEEETKKRRRRDDDDEKKRIMRRECVRCSTQ